MILHKGNQKVIKSNQREKLKITNLRWLWRFLKGFDSPTDYYIYLKIFLRKVRRPFFFCGKYHNLIEPFFLNRNVLYIVCMNSDHFTFRIE